MTEDSIACSPWQTLSDQHKPNFRGEYFKIFHLYLAFIHLSIKFKRNL